jgi:ribonuclease HI
MVEWRENQIPTPMDKPEHWTMYFDGSLKLDGGGAGVLFISPRGEQLKYILQILWEVSNNEAEYEALLHGLCLAISLGIKRLLVYGDCNKETMETMDAYVQEVHKLENKFSGLEVWQNRLNYSGSSALVIAILAILTQRTSNGTTHWSVGSPPDTTTV